MQTVITNANFNQTINTLKSKFDNLSQNGSFFAIFQTEYDCQGNVIHDFMDIISYANQIGYQYVNTIVYPTLKIQTVSFIDNVKYVIWLCKSKTKMLFDKDAIREKHIWKDVEWGKRTKNYNAKGKDPGNVWIPTRDDGKAHITEHMMLEDEEIIKKLIAMANCENSYEIIRSKIECLNLKRSPVFPEHTETKYKQNTVVFGSCENMNHICNASVKLVITSPPYWNLKDYFKKGQIGQESYEVYLQRMEKVWTECYNKLSKDGSLWININIRQQGGKVILIPHDFIISCKKIGFFYKGILIWHKSSGIPAGEKNISDHHEYVLIFSKKNDFFVDFNAFKNYGDYKNKHINGGAFWNINRKAGSVGKKYIHPAIYPNELVNRVINIASQPNDLVLDPFLGSGTSLISARQNGRQFIGYEYYEGFKELMSLRFNSEIPNEIVEYIYEKM